MKRKNIGTTTDRGRKGLYCIKGTYIFCPWTETSKESKAGSINTRRWRQWSEGPIGMLGNWVQMLFSFCESAGFLAKRLPSLLWDDSRSRKFHRNKYQVFFSLSHYYSYVLTFWPHVKTEKHFKLRVKVKFLDFFVVGRLPQSKQMKYTDIKSSKGKICSRIRTRAGKKCFQQRIL